MCVYERENRADKRKQFPVAAVVEVVVACLLSFQRWNKIIIIMMMLLPPIEIISFVLILERRSVDSKVIY